MLAGRRELLARTGLQAWSDCGGDLESRFSKDT
jgi:hypothetical protein